jgi:hypothetical protein
MPRVLPRLETRRHFARFGHHLRQLAGCGISGSSDLYYDYKMTRKHSTRQADEAPT